MNFLALFNPGAVWKFDMLPMIYLYMNKQNIMSLVVVYVKKIIIIICRRASEMS